MGAMVEDFSRCTECDNPYFTIKDVVLIAKGSPTEGPQILRKMTEYRCSKCGNLEFKSEE